MYTNNFPHISVGKVISYADDTNIITTGSNITEVVTNMNRCLNRAVDWFKNNRIVVNASKSSIMFTSSHMIDYLDDPAPLMINNPPLERVTRAKFLGVMIDETLSWNVQIHYNCLKINYKIELINRLRQYLLQSVLKTFYLTLIQPHFDYCLTVWGKCAVKYST